MIYDNMIKGIFIKRINRFIAEVLIDNKNEYAHIKNTGRCKELLISGAIVLLQESNNPERKTKYSLISIYKENMLVNMDSQVPNAVVFEAIQSNKIPSLANMDFLKREVTYGSSRFDVYYERNGIKGYIEVKGVTLEKDGLSMFPDAPTKRGSKHVLELIEAKKQGFEASIFFVIQMDNISKFTINKEMDNDFYTAIKLAKENGVNIFAYNSIVSTNEIVLNNPIEVLI